MSKKKLNLDELSKASKALRYEWWMLTECAAQIPRFRNTNQVVHNALIEAFCVHVRNFIEFFHGAKPSEVRCEDFFRSGDHPKPKHNLKGKYSQKVNNLLSHLTYNRLEYTESDKEWDIPSIASEVNENMFQFTDAADKSLLCDEIIQYRRQLESPNGTQDKTFLDTTSDTVATGTTVPYRHGPTPFKIQTNIQ